jgi:hypothetical protein
VQRTTNTVTARENPGSSEEKENGDNQDIFAPQFIPTIAWQAAGILHEVHTRKNHQ